MCHLLILLWRQQHLVYDVYDTITTLDVGVYNFWEPIYGNVSESVTRNRDFATLQSWHLLKTCQVWRQNSCANHVIFQDVCDLFLSEFVQLVLDLCKRLIGWSKKSTAICEGRQKWISDDELIYGRQKGNATKQSCLNLRHRYSLR